MTRSGMIYVQVDQGNISDFKTFKSKSIQQFRRVADLHLNLNPVQRKLRIKTFNLS